MKELRLKNGSQELDITIAATITSLKGLLADQPIAFCDLVMKARDDTYEPFGNAGDILKRSSLLKQAGTMRQDIRNIVLSAVDGDEGEMHIVDPIDRSAAG